MRRTDFAGTGTRFARVVTPPLEATLTTLTKEVPDPAILAISSRVTLNAVELEDGLLATVVAEAPDPVPTDPDVALRKTPEFGDPMFGAAIATSVNAKVFSKDSSPRLRLSN